MFGWIPYIDKFHDLLRSFVNEKIEKSNFRRLPTYLYFVQHIFTLFGTCWHCAGLYCADVNCTGKRRKLAFYLTLTIVPHILWHFPVLDLENIVKLISINLCRLKILIMAVCVTLVSHKNLLFLCNSNSCFTWNALIIYPPHCLIIQMFWWILPMFWWITLPQVLINNPPPHVLINNSP